MSKKKLITGIALAVLLVFDILEIVIDGWSWLRGAAAAIAAVALVLTLVAEVRHG